MLITYRCFTFGIGSGALTALVKGIARAGNRSAEFIADNESMQSKVQVYLCIDQKYTFHILHCQTSLIML